LRGHSIPQPFAQTAKGKAELRDQWNVKRYSDFTRERAVLLSQGANEILQKLESS